VIISTPKNNILTNMPLTQTQHHRHLERRYAWRKHNWSQVNIFFLSNRVHVLLYYIPIYSHTQACRDVFDLADGKKNTHFFGRMTCVESKSTLVVIDGQQRSTTLTLMLAACRDISDAIGSKKQAREIDRYLFVEDTLKVKMISVKSCRLVPTICDRDSYLRAILPGHLEVFQDQDHILSFGTNRLEQAKRFFVKTLQNTGRVTESKIGAVVNAIMAKVRWLLFPIEVGGREDGTEDLGVIFERLALREAMFTRPMNKSCYAEMASCDFVRNLLLGGFSGNEALALKMYEHWLIVERKANVIGRGQGEDILEDMLVAYLEVNRTAIQSAEGTVNKTSTSGSGVSSATFHSHTSKMIGGDLYADFRQYVASSSLDAKTLLFKVKTSALEFFEKKKAKKMQE